MNALVRLLETMLRICIKLVLAVFAGFVAFIGAITRRR
jgi:hypothetical protein